MLKKQSKNVRPVLFKGFSLITQQNLASKVRKYTDKQQFYQVQLAQVVKVLTQDDVSENYPSHQHGSILCRILYSQMNQEQDNLKVMIPRNSSLINIPVVGQIVLCSKHPSYQVDVKQGMIFDQYYYFDILNILNSQNNNSIPGVSYSKQTFIQNENTLGKQFIVDNQIQKIKYKQGDVVLSGRYGHYIKMTYENINKKTNPKVIINNRQSYIRLERHNQDDDYITPSSTDERGQKSLKGDNIILQSDRVIINSVKKNNQLYSKVDLVLSANQNVFVDGKKVQINAKQIVISVGENKVTINSSGVSISASKINLQGQTSISGIINGSTPGFCSIPICPFTGAPHTTNVVGN